ncbi:hypothetical protein K402DRAFT_388953 [Aulographum hederae CBS 113979]|uniref:glucokinase n=1 Tax=Aulographum hederae CBS 113979 TaxID=1176131 RepID=A0A6G1HE90_9PEZI|nr:hypothetical protein K402DRAFT_388953 [Aulographum hederae CBS 113979]
MLEDSSPAAQFNLSSPSASSHQRTSSPVHFQTQKSSGKRFERTRRFLRGLPLQSRVQWLSAVVLVLVLVLQFLFQPPSFQVHTDPSSLSPSSDFNLPPNRGRAAAVLGNWLPTRLLTETATSTFTATTTATATHLKIIDSCPTSEAFESRSTIEPAVCVGAERAEDRKKNSPHEGTFYTTTERSMALSDEAKKVADAFEFGDEAVRKAVTEFIRQMDEGLKEDGKYLSQIPTYVTAVPNGTEKGLYMAVDLGGTNFRVCSILLHGNSTFSLTQSKVKIPHELMVAKTAKELFAFLAKQIEAFLKEHHSEHYHGHISRRTTSTLDEMDQNVKNGVREQEIFNLGFTFSFPIKQIGINRGTLLRWTKGFDIADAVGKDVCALLQNEIDLLNLPVKVAALVNDTVGTLMARSYTSPGKSGTFLGAIFGTGTNGAYVESLSKLTKLTDGSTETSDYDKSTGEMIVNTEWGNFDGASKVLPTTSYDIELDSETVNPGLQLFEKQVSGMFLGEILRKAILSLINNPAIPLFQDENSSTNDVHSTTTIYPDSPLFKQWGLDTSFLSLCASDESKGCKPIRQAMNKELGIHASSLEDAEAVKTIAMAIGRRAARLAAVPIGACIVATDKLKSSNETIDVGVDGSLVEFYPDFEILIREALRAIPEIGEAGEKRIRIGIAKDGSGVGAALIALVAGNVGTPKDTTPLAKD